MQPVAIASLWLCLIASSWAKPPLFLSYQDSIGQYSFGYSEPMSARSEYRTADGLTRGTYSYIDRNGLIQTAEYEAGGDFGFRVTATNLPQAPLPVRDTPEVMAARQRHLQLLDEARRRDEQDRALEAPLASAPGAPEVIQPAETMLTGPLVAEEPRQATGSRPVIQPRNALAAAVDQPKAQQLPLGPQVANLPEQQGEKTALAKAVVPVAIAAEQPVRSRGKIETRSSDRSIINQASIPISAPVVSEPSVAAPLQAEAAQGAVGKSSGKIEVEARSVVNQQSSIPIAFPPLLTRGPAPALNEPVGYTPEVMAAREAHFRAYETAAKLAAETDANPRLLEQLLRGQAMALPMTPANMENREMMSEPGAPRPHDYQVPAFARPIQSSDPGTLRPIHSMRIDLAMVDPMKMPIMDKPKDMEKTMEKARIDEAPKSIDATITGSGLTPASTSLRVMDIRLPSLNEFQQTKLKAGAYNTPIEISHLSPTNLLPKPYHPFFGSSSFYVYL